MALNSGTTVGFHRSYSFGRGTLGSLDPEPKLPDTALVLAHQWAEPEA